MDKKKFWLALVVSLLALLLAIQGVAFAAGERSHTSGYQGMSMVGDMAEMDHDGEGSHGTADIAGMDHRGDMAEMMHGGEDSHDMTDMAGMMHHDE